MSENLNKVLDLLNVPEELGIYNGQIQNKTEYQILETTVRDDRFYEMVLNPRTGKMVPKRITKTWKEYSVIEKKQKFGYYGLNLISSYIHSFGAAYTGINAEGKHELFSPEFTGKISVGPFKDKSYHFNWQRVEIEKTANGCIFTETHDQGISVDSNGNPIPNEADYRIVIQRRDKSIVSSFSSNLKGPAPIFSNVRETLINRNPASVTKGYLLENMNIDENALADMTKVIFECIDVPSTTHVESLAANISGAGNVYKGDIYINGMDSEQIPYTNLIASMGLKFPQVVQRWRLYNGDDVREKVYGSTWLKQMSFSELNEITVIAGDAFSWNESTKTLTYDASKPTHLWYQYECLPAQGKNEGWEYILDLNTGLEVTRK
jgi:hypothetical protein